MAERKEQYRTTDWQSLKYDLKYRKKTYRFILLMKPACNTQSNVYGTFREVAIEYLFFSRNEEIVLVGLTDCKVTTTEIELYLKNNFDVVHDQTIVLLTKF